MVGESKKKEQLKAEAETESMALEISTVVPEKAEEALDFQFTGDSSIDLAELQELEKAEEEKTKTATPKNIIEAALFMSSKPLTVDDFAKYTGIPAVGYVGQIVNELRQDYEKSGSAIVISEENGKYVMRVRNEYARVVGELAQESEISKGALRLLAYVSQNEGVNQAKAVKALGSTVYEYVKELVQNEFITAEKKGRSRELRTTKKFKDYFAV